MKTKVNKLSELMFDRVSRLCQKMKEENLDAIVFRDSEECRNPAVRYFSRVPTDAILVIDKNAHSMLAAWDVNLAKEIGAFTEKVFAYTQFGRDPIAATAGLLKKLGVKDNSRIEIDPTTPYPQFLDYVDQLQQYDVLCRDTGVHSYVDQLRSVKDEYEIECTRKACEITNRILDQIQEKIKDSSIKTELDVAFLIEKMCRSEGCERTSFETLAAGPARSYAIHAFPSYTASEFGSNGLSLVDFGVSYEGYASDVTLTIAKGQLSEKQELMLSLVQKAADECLKYYKKDLPVRQAALKADKIFSSAKMKMPHSLGHGTGLEIHEAPFIRSKAALETVFQPGNIVTLEPGLYDAECGGVRLENDVLITEEGNEVLTQSRILRIN
ncbi:MAG: Xaa-Pro peptidase family protein [Treponemataceae bacterium]|nr:Xaa-Pro peptidase family protein [Treponemataceae bacterium]